MTKESYNGFCHLELLYFYLFIHFHGYRVSDASGELETTEVGSYPLKMGLLDTKVSSVGTCRLNDGYTDKGHSNTI